MFYETPGGRVLLLTAEQIASVADAYPSIEPVDRFAPVWTVPSDGTPLDLGDGQVAVWVPLLNSVLVMPNPGVAFRAVVKSPNGGMP